VNDPALLIPAMAYVTEHLGFAFTSSVLQTPPFTFARQLSTLDHLTRGRVAWNIVTSYLPNAAASLGYGDLPPHEARYERADEYVERIRISFFKNPPFCPSPQGETMGRGGQMRGITGWIWVQGRGTDLRYGHYKAAGRQRHLQADLPRSLGAL